MYRSQGGLQYYVWDMPGMWLFPRGLATACGHGIAGIGRLHKQYRISTARRDIVNHIGIIEMTNKEKDWHLSSKALETDKNKIEF
jgi:hypothetical protein